MRKVIEPQTKFGQVNIENITIDCKSRDDIPKILLGLQHIYKTPDLRDRIFAILKNIIPERKGANVQGKVDPQNGRPGMEQWKILVLGVLRLGLNSDYDRIQELANNHNTIRQMLGHSGWDDKFYYELQTIKDNLHLFTPEILDEINQEVIYAGHRLLKKTGEPISTRADSFVVETNIHYPTDINLLFDAVRKMIEICMQLSNKQGITTWRQGAYQIRRFKKLYRKIQKTKHSTAKDPEKKLIRQELIKELHQTYITDAKNYITTVQETKIALIIAKCQDKLLIKIDEYIIHAQRQIDQINRRVLLGETIPHKEKVFSIFQPHTEWISKGKAGVSVEFGLPVSIVEDSDGFILYHEVMEKTVDSAITISLAKATKERFSEIVSMSFDKGYHSLPNQKALAEIIDLPVLPRKGRRSKEDQQRESNPEFIHLRRKHSAVESAINALEVHGLDFCPDSGIEGFKRYIALAVVGKNMHQLGAILRKQELVRQRRRRSHLKAA